MYVCVCVCVCVCGLYTPVARVTLHMNAHVAQQNTQYIYIYIYIYIYRRSIRLNSAMADTGARCRAKVRSAIGTMLPGHR
jgi:hypothetical protein